MNLKFLTTIALCIGSLAPAYSAESADSRTDSPDAVIRTQHPQKFFAKAFELMRKIYPDPKAEMQYSFMLLPLGYPNFSGISRDVGITVCAFDIFENPTILTAVKASDASAFAALADASKMTVEKSGGWIFAQIPAKNPPSKARIEAAKRESERSTKHIAEISFDGSAVAKYENFIPKDFARDVESASISIDDEGGRLRLLANFKIRKDSQTEKFLNSAKRARGSREISLLPQDSDITIISRIESEDAAEFFGNWSASFMPPEIAEAYKPMLEKSAGTFAMTANLGKETSFASAAATSISAAEFLDLARRTPEIKLNVAGQSATVRNKIILLNGIEAVETSTDGTDSKSYAAVVNGFTVSADSPEIFKKMVAATSQKNIDSPLKKYAEDDFDLIAVVNNRAIVSRLASAFGKTKKNFDSENGIVAVSLKPRQIEITVLADTNVLNVYCDLYRMMSKQNGTTQKTGGDNRAL